jgi:hypothetical protein
MAAYYLETVYFLFSQGVNSASHSPAAAVQDITVDRNSPAIPYKVHPFLLRKHVSIHRPINPSLYGAGIPANMNSLSKPRTCSQQDNPKGNNSGS